jgi:hypothetical protein
MLQGTIAGGGEIDAVRRRLGERDDVGDRLGAVRIPDAESQPAHTTGVEPQPVGIHRVETHDRDSAAGGAKAASGI